MSQGYAMWPQAALMWIAGFICIQWWTLNHRFDALVYLGACLLGLACYFAPNLKQAYQSSRATRGEPTWAHAAPLVRRSAIFFACLLLGMLWGYLHRPRCLELFDPQCFVRTYLNDPGASETWARLRQSAQADRSAWLAEFHLPLNLPWLEGWFAAVYAGEVGSLARELKKTFLELGIYHLMIVSGLHFRYYANLICWVVFLPFRLLFTLPFVPSHLWVQIRPPLRMMCQALLFQVALWLGFRPPCCRAVLMSSLRSLPEWSHLKLTRGTCLLYAFILQCLFMPMMMWSRSAMMSWIAYLIVTRPTRRPTGASASEPILSRKSWAYAWESQLLLALAVFCLFHQFSLTGVWLNLVIGPVFAAVFFSGAVLLPTLQMGEQAWLRPWQELVLAIQSLFLESITALHRLLVEYDLLGFIDIKTILDNHSSQHLMTGYLSAHLDRVTNLLTIGMLIWLVYAHSHTKGQVLTTAKIHAGRSSKDND